MQVTYHTKDINMKIEEVKDDIINPIKVECEELRSELDELKQKHEELESSYILIHKHIRNMGWAWILSTIAAIFVGWLVGTMV